VVHGRKGQLARESVVQASLLVATEIAEIEGRDLNVLLSGASAVKEEWLRELFPEDFSATETVVYDTTMRRVFVERQKRFRDLVLEAERVEIVGQASRLSNTSTRSSGTLDPLGEAARILAGEVTAGRLVLNEWNEAVEQWIVRVNCLRQWMPELELPAITGADRALLVEQVCHGAVSYKEIKDKPVWPVVKSWLSGQQQAWVEQYAPERLELPGGRRAKITYAGDGPPKLAARIQDLYGVKGLWVAQQRVPLLIEILAPNQRPVQVTQNLANFWRETYPQLKKELQRKYPKHEWR
jgi:ATP-dependent helicase HrpB